MNKTLSEKQSFLAWSLLLVLILLVLMFAVVPAVTYSNQLSEQISDGYRKLSKFRQIAKATPEFMAEYERVKSQGLDQLFYPEGMTAAQVGKELQSQLTNLIRRGGGISVSSEVLEGDNEEDATGSGYERVTVRAIFHGKPTLLRQILHQSYQSRPLVFVDSLEVRPLDKRDEMSQQLKAEVTVTTYWRGGGQ